jgi:hypothetical protein
VRDNLTKGSSRLGDLKMFTENLNNITQANSLVKIKGENFYNIRNAMQEHYRCDALRKTRERAKRAFKGGVLGVGVLGGRLKPLSRVNL